MWNGKAAMKTSTVCMRQEHALWTEMFLQNINQSRTGTRGSNKDYINVIVHTYSMAALIATYKISS